MDSVVMHVPSGHGSKTRRIELILASAAVARTATDIAIEVVCSTALVHLIAGRMKVQLRRDNRPRGYGQYSRVPRTSLELLPVPAHIERQQPTAETYNHAKQAQENKEARLRRELARDLEAIWRRQQARWGGF